MDDPAVLTTAVGVVATICGLARAWPQAVSIIVRGNTQGVSALTWMLSLGAFISWLAIGIVERIGPTIVFNALAIVSTSAVLYVLVTHRALQMWRPLSLALLAVFVNVAVYAVFGAPGVAFLGVTISMVMFLPQVFTVLRQPSSGVSVATWWLALTTSALWILYGLMIGKFVLIAPNLVMIPAAAVVLAGVVFARHRTGSKIASSAT